MCQLFPSLSNPLIIRHSSFLLYHTERSHPLFFTHRNYSWPHSKLWYHPSIAACTSPHTSCDNTAPSALCVINSTQQCFVSCFVTLPTDNNQSTISSYHQVSYYAHSVLCTVESICDPLLITNSSGDTCYFTIYTHNNHTCYFSGGVLWLSKHTRKPESVESSQSVKVVKRPKSARKGRSKFKQIWCKIYTSFLLFSESHCHILWHKWTSS